MSIFVWTAVAVVVPHITNRLDKTKNREPSADSPAHVRSTPRTPGSSLHLLRGEKLFKQNVSQFSYSTVWERTDRRKNLFKFVFRYHQSRTNKFVDRKRVIIAGWWTVSVASAQRSCIKTATAQWPRVLCARVGYPCNGNPTIQYHTMYS